jgi:hypothetical protein
LQATFSPTLALRLDLVDTSLTPPPTRVQVTAADGRVREPTRSAAPCWVSRLPGSFGPGSFGHDGQRTYDPVVDRPTALPQIALVAAHANEKPTVDEASVRTAITETTGHIA